MAKPTGKASTSNSKKPKQRVNGIAAGIALLRIYENRLGNDRDSSIRYTPIECFLEELRKADSRAETGFWVVVSDYLETVADGCVPKADYYSKSLNIAREDELRVRELLGYVN